MFKIFKKWLTNELGVIHLIPLLLILAGIVAGVYLVQHPQIFKPKAAADVVEFLEGDGSCVTVKDGKKVTTCPQVKVRFTSPLEIQGSSDAGFQLVKTAYANHPADTEDWYCGGGNKDEVWHSKRYNSDFTDGPDDYLRNAWADVWNLPWDLHEKVKTCEAGKNLVCKEFPHKGYKQIANCFPTDQKPPQQPVQKANPANIKPRGTVTVTSDGGFITFVWLGESGTGKYRFFIDSDDDNRTGMQGTNCSAGSYGFFLCKEKYENGINIGHQGNLEGENPDLVGGQILIQRNLFKDGVTYTWWVDALDKNGETIGTSNGFDFIIVKKKVDKAPLVCPEVAFDESDKSYGPVLTATIANKSDSSFEEGPLEAHFGVYHCKTAGGIESPCAPDLTPQDLVKTIKFDTVTLNIPAKGSTARQSFSADRVNCGRVQVDIGLTNECGVVGGTVYNLGRSCGVPATGGIITPPAEPDPTPTKPAPEKTTPTPSPTPAGGSQPGVGATPSPQPAQPEKRTTKSYRYAFSPAELVSAPWRPYTQQGGVVETITLSDSNPGLKYIFVQFQDDQEKIINDRYYTVSIELVAATTTTPSPSPKAPPPAGGGSTTTGCPLDSYANFDIPTLKQKCTSTELAKLPTEALKDFSNQDLVNIAKSVDGTAGPYKFLSQFDNNRLASFDLDILKTLTKDRINQLPENLKNAISGTGSSSAEEASCTRLSTSVDVVGGSLARALVRFSGNPTTLKLWVASNSDIGKNADDVASWTNVSTIPSPKPETYQINITGFSVGKHAVLMSLHGSFGQMLDGNPNEKVNSACASSIDIQ